MKRVMYLFALVALAGAATACDGDSPGDVTFARSRS